MAAQSLLPGYVLHTRRYGDSSLIVDLYTRDEGRVAGIVKGAYGNRRGGTQPQSFQPLMIALRGRGEVRTLSNLERAGRPLSLLGSFLYCGLYLNELLLKLTVREDPCSGLYEDYAKAVLALSEQLEPEPVLRRFEVALLGHLGHGMILDRDVAGQQIDPDARYNYDIATGPSCTAALGGGTVSGATLLALREGQFGRATMSREARTLMRAVLNHYLDGRILRSRELFR